MLVEIVPVHRVQIQNVAGLCLDLTVGMRTQVGGIGKAQTLERQAVDLLRGSAVLCRRTVHGDELVERRHNELHGIGVSAVGDVIDLLCGAVKIPFARAVQTLKAVLDEVRIVDLHAGLFLRAPESVSLHRDLRAVAALLDLRDGEDAVGPADLVDELDIGRVAPLVHVCKLVLDVIAIRVAVHLRQMRQCPCADSFLVQHVDCKLGQRAVHVQIARIRQACGVIFPRRQTFRKAGDVGTLRPRAIETAAAGEHDVVGVAGALPDDGIALRRGILDGKCERLVEHVFAAGDLDDHVARPAAVQFADSLLCAFERLEGGLPAQAVIVVPAGFAADIERLHDGVFLGVDRPLLCACADRGRPGGQIHPLIRLLVRLHAGIQIEVRIDIRQIRIGRKAQAHSLCRLVDPRRLRQALGHE